MEQNFTPLPVQNMQQHEGSVNYIWLGTIIGFIIAVIAAGGVYYKIRLNLLSAQTKQTTTLTQIASTSPNQNILIEPTVFVSKPIASPTVMQSKEDIVSQNLALDLMDLSSLSAELDKNTQDAVDFTQ